MAYRGHIGKAIIRNGAIVRPNAVDRGETLRNNPAVSLASTFPTALDRAGNTATSTSRLIAERDLMNHSLLVALGGAIGSLARYQLSGLVLRTTNSSPLWLGTFTVNVVGCFVVGLISGLIVKHEWFSPDVRMFLLTGMAGGFTTFSAFGVETFNMLHRSHWTMALTYVGLSITVGIGLLAAGYSLIPSKAV